MCVCVCSVDDGGAGGAARGDWNNQSSNFSALRLIDFYKYNHIVRKIIPSYLLCYLLQLSSLAVSKCMSQPQVFPPPLIATKRQFQMPISNYHPKTLFARLLSRYCLLLSLWRTKAAVNKCWRLRIDLKCLLQLEGMNWRISLEALQKGGGGGGECESLRTVSKKLMVGRRRGGGGYRRDTHVYSPCLW